MRWSDLLVLLVGAAALLGTESTAQGAPNTALYERHTARTQGLSELVFSNVAFPRIVAVFFDRLVYDYEVISATRVRVKYSSGKTLDLVQKFRSSQNCWTQCMLEVQIERDQVSEYGGTAYLLFQVDDFQGWQTDLRVGFRVKNSNSEFKAREMRVMVWTMLDNAVKFFRPGQCTSEPKQSGLCNNRRNVASGAFNQVLLRMFNHYGANSITNPAYQDGMAAPRQNRLPNPRDISNRVTEVPTIRSGFKLTDLFVTFGQFLDHDIVLTPGGGSSGLFADKSMEIWVNDRRDKIFNEGKIMFTRSAYDRRDLGNDNYQDVMPRQHLNCQTSFVDASQVYGATHDRMYLRTFKHGLMKTNTTYAGVYLPNNIPSKVGLKQHMDPDPNDTRFHAAGDPRANENLLLLSLHTLFVREHNRIAGLLRDTTCWNCSDGKLFNLARRVVMTEMQMITYEEWLPLLLGYKLEYHEYGDWYDAGIMQEFSTAAMRFGHSMQSEDHLLLGQGRNPRRKKVNLKESFFNPDLLRKYGMESFIRGAAQQIAQPFDHKINESLRNFLFRKVPHAMGVDLFAANIQRGRDHGLPSYNQVRLMCWMHELDFHEIAGGIPGMTEVLKELYEKPGDVDLFVGGILEPRVNGGELGETFSCIVHRQFDALMHGDRFFYKNNNVKFPDEIMDCPALKDIVKGNTNFRDIILQNTDIKSNELPWNLFEM